MMIYKINKRPLILYILTFFLNAFASERIEPKSTQYSLSTPIEYHNAESGGSLSLLKFGNKIIDTIETNFGFHVIGKDSIIYYKVSCDPVFKDSSGAINGCFGGAHNLMLFFDGKYIDISSELPNFNQYFSAPIFYNGFFYYWGVKDVDDYLNNVFAIKYNFKSKQLNEIFLTRHKPGLGYTGYWCPIEKGEIFEFKRDDPTVDSIYIYAVNFNEKKIINISSKKRIVNIEK